MLPRPLETTAGVSEERSGWEEGGRDSTTWFVQPITTGLLLLSVRSEKRFLFISAKVCGSSVNCVYQGHGRSTGSFSLSRRLKLLENRANRPADKSGPEKRNPYSFSTALNLPSASGGFPPHQTRAGEEATGTPLHDAGFSIGDRSSAQISTATDWHAFFTQGFPGNSRSGS